MDGTHLKVLKDGAVPEDSAEARKLWIRSTRYCLIDDRFYRKYLYALYEVLGSIRGSYGYDNDS